MFSLPQTFGHLSMGLSKQPSKQTVGKWEDEVAPHLCEEQNDELCKTFFGILKTHTKTRKELMQPERRAHYRHARVSLCAQLGDTSPLNEPSEMKLEKYQHNKLPDSSLLVCLRSDTAE